MPYREWLLLELGVVRGIENWISYAIGRLIEEGRILESGHLSTEGHLNGRKEVHIGRKAV